MHTLRWLLLPVVFLLASTLGIYCWIQLGSWLVAHCALDSSWTGGASSTVKCRLPLALTLTLAKDIAGATTLALLMVLGCAAIAPSSKRQIGFAVAIFSAASAVIYFLLSHNPWTNALPHRIAVAMSFFLALFLAAAALPKSPSTRPAGRADSSGEVSNWFAQ